MEGTSAYQAAGGGATRPTTLPVGGRYNHPMPTPAPRCSVTQKGKGRGSLCRGRPLGHVETVVGRHDIEPLLRSKTERPPGHTVAKLGPRVEWKLDCRECNEGNAHC